MKIKVNFVTNSSSSSYIILGELLPPESVNEEEIKSSNIICLGKYLDEGQDVFDLTIEIFKEMKINGINEDIVFVSVINRSFEEGYMPIYSSIEVERGKPIYVYSGDADYHNTETPEDYKRRYVDGDNY